VDASAEAREVEARSAVGPVLIAGPLSNAVVAAIQDENRDVVVLDRGAYLRVLVPRRCVVTRAGVEQRTGQPFRLPTDLEAIMASFKGKLALDASGAVWSLPGEGER